MLLLAFLPLPHDERDLRTASGGGLDVETVDQPPAPARQAQAEPAAAGEAVLQGLLDVLDAGPLVPRL